MTSEHFTSWALLYSQLCKWVSRKALESFSTGRLTYFPHSSRQCRDDLRKLSTLFFLRASAIDLSFRSTFFSAEKKNKKQKLNRQKRCLLIDYNMLSHYIAEIFSCFSFSSAEFEIEIGLLALFRRERCCYFRFLSAKLFPTEKKINKKIQSCFAKNV